MPCYFALDDCAKKLWEMWIAQILGSKQRFPRRLVAVGKRLTLSSKEKKWHSLPQCNVNSRVMLSKAFPSPPILIDGMGKGKIKVNRGANSFRGSAMGGQGGKSPLKISKKGKIKKYGVFSCIKVIKINFSVTFNKEIRALEGPLSRF